MGAPNNLITAAKALLADSTLVFDARNEIICALLSYSDVLETERDVIEKSSRDWHANWRKAKVALSHSERTREAAERARDEALTHLSLMTRDRDEARATIAKLDTELQEVSQERDEYLATVNAQNRVVDRVKALHTNASRGSHTSDAIWVKYIEEALALGSPQEPGFETAAEVHSNGNGATVALVGE